MNGTYPITFSCEAIGEPVPTFSWYFNAERIDDTNKYNTNVNENFTVVTSVLELAIQNESNIVGTYTCEANNSIGMDRESAVLTINGK